MFGHPQNRRFGEHRLVGLFDVSLEFAQARMAADRSCCYEQIRLRESMTHCLASFHEATLDDKNIFVDIEQPL
jgi:hypothetical protein